MDEGKNLRAFFEEFARKRDFDPLVLENWYPMQLEDIMAEKVWKLIHFIDITNGNRAELLC